MLKVFTDREDFDLGIEDYGLSGGSDINIYVLDEHMSALSLMEAFRACRHNPLRTYYYIPETKSNFSKYATESISRGTVNVFSDLDELKSSLQGEVEAWRSYSVPECVKKSAANYKFLLNRDTATSLSVAVTSALHKNSCYTVAAALVKMLDSGNHLLASEFIRCKEQLLEESEKVKRAEKEFGFYGSQFLSVLAAGGKKTDPAWQTEEYDGITMHVMLQPFEPDSRDLDNRVKIVAQLRKETKKHLKESQAKQGSDIQQE